jgi:deoxyribonuclease-1
MKWSKSSLGCLVIFIISNGFSSIVFGQQHISNTEILGTVYLVPFKSYYCSCEYSNISKRVKSNDECSYMVQKHRGFKQRIQIEHIVPVSILAKDLFCWRSGGRNGCAGIRQYEEMIGDLHNLVPALESINRARSNYYFGNVDYGIRLIGTCNLAIDKVARKVEPASDIKGDIARIYFYMLDRYQLTIPEETIKVLTLWSTLDPVDQREKDRDYRIMRHQGNFNPYVSNK